MFFLKAETSQNLGCARAKARVQSHCHLKKLLRGAFVHAVSGPWPLAIALPLSMANFLWFFIRCQWSLIVFGQWLMAANGLILLLNKNPHPSMNKWRYHYFDLFEIVATSEVFGGARQPRSFASICGFLCGGYGNGQILCYLAPCSQCAGEWGGRAGQAGGPSKWKRWLCFGHHAPAPDSQRHIYASAWMLSNGPPDMARKSIYVPTLARSYLAWYQSSIDRQPFHVQLRCICVLLWVYHLLSGICNCH